MDVPTKRESKSSLERIGQRAKNCRGLAEAYEKLGDTENAEKCYALYKKFSDIHDSIKETLFER